MHTNFELSKHFLPMSLGEDENANLNFSDQMYEFIRMSKLLQNDFNFQINSDAKLKN